MSWIASAGDFPPLEGLFAHRSELLSRYKAFYRALWDDGLVPRRVLELCRLRVAAIHDCAAEWAVRDANVALDSPEAAALKRGDFAAFTAGEQTALAIAEQFPFQHHAVSDEDVAAAAEAFWRGRRGHAHGGAGVLRRDLPLEAGLRFGGMAGRSGLAATPTKGALV